MSGTHEDVTPGNMEVRCALVADDTGYSVEDRTVTDALAVAEDRHFWHQTRNELIARELRRHGVDGGSVLDLGCGGGCVTRYLAELGYRVTGVEGHVELAKRAALRAPNARILVDNILNADLMADQAGAFDAVGLFDVIEHLDEPGRVLSGALRLARPGGLLIGTVPALPSLWSDADRIAHHRLRYTREGLLRALVDVAEDRKVEAIWFNRLLVPMIWATRRNARGTEALGLAVPWGPANALMKTVLRAEHAAARLFKALNDIPGASLLFTVQRSNAAAIPH